MSKSEGFKVTAGNVEDRIGLWPVSFTLKYHWITLQISQLDANLESAVLCQVSLAGIFVPRKYRIRRSRTV